jgi:hypothetical protein
MRAPAALHRGCIALHASQARVDGPDTLLPSGGEGRLAGDSACDLELEAMWHKEQQQEQQQE